MKPLAVSGAVHVLRSALVRAVERSCRGPGSSPWGALPAIRSLGELADLVPNNAHRLSPTNENEGDDEGLFGAALHAVLEALGKINASVVAQQEDIEGDFPEDGIVDMLRASYLLAQRLRAVATLVPRAWASLLLRTHQGDTAPSSSGQLARGALLRFLREIYDGARSPKLGKSELRALEGLPVALLRQYSAEGRYGPNRVALEHLITVICSSDAEGALQTIGVIATGGERLYRPALSSNKLHTFTT